MADIYDSDKRSEIMKKIKNKNLFPIPNSAISANNLIEQNPGY